MTTRQAPSLAEANTTAATFTEVPLNSLFKSNTYRMIPAVPKDFNPAVITTTPTSAQTSVWPKVGVMGDNTSQYALVDAVQFQLGHQFIVVCPAVAPTGKVDLTVVSNVPAVALTFNKQTSPRYIASRPGSCSLPQGKAKVISQKGEVVNDLSELLNILLGEIAKNNYTVEPSETYNYISTLDTRRLYCAPEQAMSPTSVHGLAIGDRCILHTSVGKYSAGMYVKITALEPAYAEITIELDEIAAVLYGVTKPPTRCSYSTVTKQINSALLEQRSRALKSVVSSASERLKQATAYTELLAEIDVLDRQAAELREYEQSHQVSVLPEYNMEQLTSIFTTTVGSRTPVVATSRIPAPLPSVPTGIAVADEEDEDYDEEEDEDYADDEDENDDFFEEEDDDESEEDEDSFEEDNED